MRPERATSWSNIHGAWPRQVALLLLAGLLTACASRPPAAVGTDVLSGRMSLRVAAGAGSAERSSTLAYDLRGNPQTGQIEFSTPLGSIVARASWAPGQVALTTEQGERRFADLDSMSREVLGEVIPVAALFDWLRGRPWPGASSRSTDNGFEQLGWQVDLSRFAESQLVARRETPPFVTVRALINRP